MSIQTMASLPLGGRKRSSCPRSSNSRHRSFAAVSPAWSVMIPSWRSPTMSNAWYEAADATAELTQGDFIFDCPISTWAESQLGLEPAETSQEHSLPEERLVRRREIISEDVIVMTQACDLANRKVTDVVLCPHFPLSMFREEVWRPEQERKREKSNSDAWAKHFNALKNGYLWNLCVLNSSTVEGLGMDLRVVEFHTVYTVPRDFLETLLRERAKPRLRLNPPYREHLSQAFARFFMRVGLPTAVART